MIVGTLLLLCIACIENKPAVRSVHAYFDLDSLLNQQIDRLVAATAEVNKSVTLNGANENEVFIPDVSIWNETVSIMRDFNLNKAYYVGLYKEQRLPNVWSYQASDDKLPVKKFDLFYDNGELVRIEALLLESKYIYSNKRELSMEFDNGLLSFYQIVGEQKMFLQDREEYIVSGSIRVK